MFQSGYMSKLLRINLATRKQSIEETDAQDYLNFLGGRGIMKGDALK